MKKSPALLSCCCDLVVFVTAGVVVVQINVSPNSLAVVLVQARLCGSKRALRLCYGYDEECLFVSNRADSM
jgi:hypothetical protein